MTAARGEVQRVERNIRLILQYDGSAYAGFQRQPNGVTIQEQLEKALGQVTGPVQRLFAAGRTDAGVHALGQVVNFYTTARIPAERLPHALNTHLPRDIVAVRAEDVPLGFHARFHARSKAYRYTFDNGSFPSPLTRPYALHAPGELDEGAMLQAAALLVGRHDFAAFRATGGAARTSERTVIRADLTWEHAPDDVLAGPWLHLTIEADGFLYNMVRIIAGTILEAGLGRRPPESVRAALVTKERRRAGMTLPPHGLCLLWVRY